MKLILHIGTPKTASTLLQNSCEANPKWLERHGVAYGRALAPDANHITLFIAAAIGIHDLSRAYGVQTPDELAQFRVALSAEIAAHLASLPQKVDTVILSTENLTGNLRSPDGIANLKQMLDPFFDEVEIVVYIRRQDDAILSMYGEFMRRGFSGATFPNFVSNCLSVTCPIPYIYYRRELQKWVEVWGRDALNVRLFDRQTFVGGEILTDFMTVVLGRPDFDMSDFHPSPSDNRGLSAPVLETLRRLWPAIPFVKARAPNATRLELMPYINELPTDPRPVMAAGRAHQIMTHFKPANLWVRDTFFPDHQGPLFAPHPNLPKAGNLGVVTEDEFAQISSRLLDPILDRAKKSSTNQPSMFKRKDILS